jgi:hypothetical protein
MENQEPAEARKCTFSPEILELTVLCARARCDEAKSTDSPAISIPTHFTLSLRRSQDFEIIFLIHCDTRWHEIICELPRKNRKKNDQCLDFLFAHARFLLYWRLWRVSFLTLLLSFRVIFRKTNILSHVMTRLRKSRSLSGL